ncbi:hypothetical protein LguiB_019376 [Lonicera macranthoides]
MEIFQELVLTVAVSLFASFALAKLLSMVSACEYTTVFKTKAVAFEQREGKGSVGFGFENVTRVGFLEEAVMVDECEEEEVIVEEMEACELPLVREIDDVDGEACREVEDFELGEKEVESESVGGGEVAEKAVDQSGEMEVSSEIEVEADQVLDESPEKMNSRELEIVLAEGKEIGILEGEGYMGNKSDDEVKINEEGEEEGLFDEWEWEGIERSELEKCFGAAVAFVGCKENADKISVLDNDLKMELCGLHKVATEGPCFEPQPMALKLSARAKWNAWNRLKNMGPEVAMEQYISLLSRNIPSWKGNDTSEVKTTLGQF